MCKQEPLSLSKQVKTMDRPQTQLNLIALAGQGLVDYASEAAEMASESTLHGNAGRLRYICGVLAAAISEPGRRWAPIFRCPPSSTRILCLWLRFCLCLSHFACIWHCKFVLHDCRRLFGAEIGSAATLFNAMDGKRKRIVDRCASVSHPTTIGAVLLSVCSATLADCVFHLLAGA